MIKNLPIEAADLFNEAGYDAATVYDQNLVGETDTNIAPICQLEKRAIVTLDLDLDFTDIRAYPPKQFSGLIVMRLKKQGNNPNVPDQKSYVQLEAVRPTTSLFIVASVATLFERVKIGVSRLESPIITLSVSV